MLAVVWLSPEVMRVAVVAGVTNRARAPLEDDGVVALKPAAEAP
jgi:hypothetical protein